MLQQAASAARDGAIPTVASNQSAASTSLLLSESQQSIGGPPPLMEKLTPREREIVLKQGRRKVLNRGQTLFNQGAKHDGIYLIESGRIRVFYTSPLGREITLAYWRAGNFVGGPEVFGGGIHQWSGDRVEQRLRGAIARQGIAHAGDRNSQSRDRPDRRPDLQGQVLFGAGANARHPLDHRSGWRICCCI